MTDEPKGSVTVLPVITKHPIPVERVLKTALEAELNDVVVIGYDSDGGEYFASSAPDGGAVIWMLERAKKRLLDVPDR